MPQQCAQLLLLLLLLVFLLLLLLVDSEVSQCVDSALVTSMKAVLFNNM